MTNRNRGAYALTAFAVALTVTACGGTKAGAGASHTPKSASGGTGSSAPASAPVGLHNSGTLAVCIDPEYPPLEYVQNGKTVGFDADGARALGDYWGVKTTLVNTAFQGLVPALKAKRCDVMWSGLYISPDRLKVADAAGVLKTGPGLIINAAETGQIKTKADLAGKTVAVQAGGTNEKIIRALSDELKKAGKMPITVQAYPQTAPTVAAVTGGKADALIETDVALPGIVKKSNGKLVVVPNIFNTSTVFGVFTDKGSPVSAATKTAITALLKNGKLASIAKTYGLDPAKLATN